MSVKLVAADTLAKQGGVKLLVYGPPGTAKTPICSTAPRPVLLSVETGTRSLAGHRFPVFHTRKPSEFEDFFKWFFTSNEAKQFDTLCVDSLSEITDLVLEERKSKNRDPRKAYGELADQLRFWIRGINAHKDRHAYLIAKMDMRLIGETSKKWPMFPGKELDAFIPHEMDEVYYVDRQAIQNVGVQLCWQTQADSSTHARSRSGRVDYYEPCDLTRLFNKIRG